MMMIKAPSEVVDGPIENVLQELHARLHCAIDGSIASYIPELARARAEWFGLSIATLDGLYFVSAGQVSVDILVGHPRRRVRVHTIPAGQAFGEVAPTLCHILSVHEFKALGANHPDIALVLFQAITRSLSSRLRQANREIRGLAD